MRKKNSNIYVQCKLKRKTEETIMQTVSWIPKNYAKVGTVVELFHLAYFNDNWEVVQTGIELAYNETTIGRSKNN